MKGEAASFDQFKLLPPLFIIVFWNLSLQNKLKYKLHRGIQFQAKSKNISISGLSLKSLILSLLLPIYLAA